jgi:dTDP-4-amino-4,6-dideoxy-D-galactose acyltransferase
MEKPCRFLEWDSDFFGVRIARINTEIVDIKTLDEINRWCNDNKIDCLYFLADPNAYDSVRLTEKQGFSLVDIRLTLEYNIRYSVRIKRPEVAPSVGIRPFQNGDLPYLKKFVVDNHKDSRFFRDPRFTEDKYRELYTYWIEKECGEEGTHVFVATYNSVPSGYITCKVSLSGEGCISLSGVNGDARNLGMGTVLMEKALACFAEHDCVCVKVVTQGANIKAQRLYTSNGFYPCDVKLWFHKWFS